ncbi:MAG: hypothetical protein KatS3mg051_1070 [Anaerolineae bacterium]|nr:MAG: hypothetical protein KatS3mg051_1070 [Anaerolineae bacterium]
MPAIRSHSTETSTGAWDGPANEARLRNDGDESLLPARLRLAGPGR